MNKIYIKYFVVMAFFMLSFTAFSQKSPIFKISSFRHDFGVIQEKDGKVSHSFTVENAGGDTLEVLKIKPSAANIEGSFAPYKLGPGAKGEIVLTYDPTNDKGKVEKLVSIRTNDPQNPIRQFGIIAEVIPSKKTIADKYPVRMGNLKLVSRHVSIDKLLSTESRTDTFRIYNDWKKPMTIQLKYPVNYVKWKIEPEVLQPGAQGLLIFTYDAKASNNYGLDIEYYRFGTNDSLEAEKLLSIGVNILEDFSYLKGNPDKRAKVHFETISHDFGTIKEGTTVDYSFPIENYGKGDLIIRKTKASCGCTLANMEKTVLKPGEKSFVRVYFNSTGMHGGETKSVTVVCNDPDNPVTMLNFNAFVEK